MGIVIYPKHKGKRGQRDMEEFVKGTISYMEMVFKRLPKKWTHEDFSKVAQEVSDEYYTRSSIREVNYLGLKPNPKQAVSGRHRR